MPAPRPLVLASCRSCGAWCRVASPARFLECRSCRAVRPLPASLAPLPAAPSAVCSACGAFVRSGLRARGLCSACVSLPPVRQPSLF